MVRDGAAACAGRVMRRRRKVTMVRGYLEREETRFNGDLSCFRMVGDGAIVGYAEGQVNSGGIRRHTCKRKDVGRLVLRRSKLKDNSRSSACGEG
jgi:hypothetical protein